MSQIIMPDGCKPGECCAKEASRYSLTDVAVLPTTEWVDVDGAERGNVAWAMATNGRLAACVECHTIGLPTSIVKVPPLALPKKGRSRLGLSRIHVGDRLECEGRIVDAPDPGTFPPVGDVLPDEFGDTCLYVDVDFLVAVSKALGSSKIKIGIEASNKPFRIVGDNGIAVVMPINQCNNEGVNIVQPAAVKRWTESVAAVRAALAGIGVEMPPDPAEVARQAETQAALDAMDAAAAAGAAPATDTADTALAPVGQAVAAAPVVNGCRAVVLPVGAAFPARPAPASQPKLSAAERQRLRDEERLRRMIESASASLGRPMPVAA